jgi:hypothetical protein
LQHCGNKGLLLGFLLLQILQLLTQKKSWRRLGLWPLKFSLFRVYHGLWRRVSRYVFKRECASYRDAVFGRRFYVQVLIGGFTSTARKMKTRKTPPSEIHLRKFGWTTVVPVGKDLCSVLLEKAHSSIAELVLIVRANGKQHGSPNNEPIKSAHSESTFIRSLSLFASGKYSGLCSPRSQLLGVLTRYVLNVPLEHEAASFNFRRL